MDTGDSSVYRYGVGAILSTDRFRDIDHSGIFVAMVAVAVRLTRRPVDLWEARTMPGVKPGRDDLANFRDRSPTAPVPDSANPSSSLTSASMIAPAPVTLEGYRIRLEPLDASHEDALVAAASDGQLWNIWFTSVPRPEQVGSYIRDGLEGQKAGHMLAWVVRELDSDTIVGTTRYHDIVAAIDRVEIGWTWYAARWQRSRVNTVCKLLLLAHAFDTLGCQVVGLRTDRFNFPSQRAIEALGARKDGVLRHHQARRDGTVRDSVMYSILLGEWLDVRQHLTWRLAKHGVE
ncbi:MAG: GCN5-related N-acetyltransferase [Geminicoccaceae bacterium]|nr:GCN5-related N-acetyltransferase [Geminicoccaceae bacterium]